MMRTSESESKIRRSEAATCLLGAGQPYREVSIP